MTIEQDLPAGPCHLRATFNPLSITGALPDSVVGDSVEYAYVVTSINAPTTCSIAGGSLPTGLSMDATGQVTGEVTDPGDYAWTVKAIDASGYVTTHADACTVATLAISGQLPNGYVGDPVNFTYTIHGGVSPVTVSISSGTLPSGLSMNTAGVVTGTLTTSGGYAWTVLATDSAGNTGSLPQTATISAAVVWSAALSSGIFNFAGLTASYRTGEGSSYVYARANKSVDASTANDYFEMVIGGTTATYDMFVGIALASFSMTAAGSPPSSHVETWMVNMTDGKFQHGGDATVSYMGACADGDVIGVLVKNGGLYFRKNGTWVGGADPVAGTGAIKTGIAGLVVPAICQTRDPQFMTARFTSGYTGALPAGSNPW